jgi:transcription-repair coupling factor (superfamily II helicase)
MIEDIKRGGGVVFVVNDVDSLQALDRWLEAVSAPLR